MARGRRTQQTMGGLTTVDNRKRSKIMLGFGLLIALALVPGLILTMAGFSTVASVTTLSALGALIPALMLSTRTGLVTAAVMTVAAAIALPASTTPWLAALTLGAIGAAVGIASRWGASNYVVLGGVSVIFLISAPPAMPSGSREDVILAAATAGSALWGVLAAYVIRRRFHKTPKQDASPMNWQRVVPFATILTIVLAVSGWLVVDLQWAHGGGWFMMTFLIILQPYMQDSWSLTIHRTTGTVAGIVLAMILYALLQEATVLLYIVAAASAALALTLRYTTKRPYWQYVLFLTPAVVLLEGVRTSVINTAEQRLLFTLLAAAVAAGLEMALMPLYRRSARIHDLAHY